MEARDLRAEFEFDGNGHLWTLKAPAGRVQLADAVALRWDEVAIDLRGAEPQLRLRADIEAFALAPLLAEERRLEATRTGGAGAYNIQRHVAVLTALLAEARRMLTEAFAGEIVGGIADEAARAYATAKVAAALGAVEGS